MHSQLTHAVARAVLGPETDEEQEEEGSLSKLRHQGVGGRGLYWLRGQLTWICWRGITTIPNPWIGYAAFG